jgi:hypothetical protein
MRAVFYVRRGGTPLDPVWLNSILGTGLFSSWETVESDCTIVELIKKGCFAGTKTALFDSSFPTSTDRLMELLNAFNQGLPYLVPIARLDSSLGRTAVPVKHLLKATFPADRSDYAVPVKLPEDLVLFLDITGLSGNMTDLYVSNFFQFTKSKIDGTFLSASLGERFQDVKLSYRSDLLHLIYANSKEDMAFLKLQLYQEAKIEDCDTYISFHMNDKNFYDPPLRGLIDNTESNSTYKLGGPVWLLREHVDMEPLFITNTYKVGLHENIPCSV